MLPPKSGEFMQAVHEIYNLSSIAVFVLLKKKFYPWMLHKTSSIMPFKREGWGEIKSWEAAGWRMAQGKLPETGIQPVPLQAWTELDIAGAIMGGVDASTFPGNMAGKIHHRHSSAGCTGLQGLGASSNIASHQGHVRSPLGLGLPTG